VFFDLNVGLINEMPSVVSSKGFDAKGKIVSLKFCWFGKLRNHIRVLFAALINNWGEETY
jgi:hypothetical protein